MYPGCIREADGCETMVALLRRPSAPGEVGPGVPLGKAKASPFAQGGLNMNNGMKRFFAVAAVALMVPAVAAASTGAYVGS